MFYGYKISNKEPVVIKILKPIDKDRIKREAKILYHLRGGKNVLDLLDFIIEPGTETVGFVFGSVSNTNMEDLYPKFSDFDHRFYLYKTLQALNYAH